MYGGAGNLITVASDIIYAILELNSSPVFAKNFLIVDNYGRGTHSDEGEAYKASLFSQLNAIYTSNFVLGPLNLGFVDFKTVWDGVLNDDPG